MWSKCVVDNFKIATMGEREQNESEEAARDVSYKQVKMTLRVELILIFFFPLLTTTLVLVNGHFAILRGYHQGYEYALHKYNSLSFFNDTSMR